ncbi:hypothetical protein C9993_08005, partial [Marinobacter sp. Z-F4-2]
FTNSADALDIKKIRGWFSTNYYNWTRERNYRFLNPKVIVEPLLFPGCPCDDYKVFCLNGKAKFLKIEIDRAGTHQHAVYTPDWQRVPVQFSTNRSQSSQKEVKRPPNLQRILSIAEELGRDFSFIRVDFYTNGDDIYVGELTNVPGDTRSVFGSHQEEEIIKSILFSNGGIKKELVEKGIVNT